MRPREATPTVKAVEELNLQQNALSIPLAWFQTMTFENGKPDLYAIAFLADLVELFSSVEIYDEKTGKIYQGRRFEEDKPVKRASYFADRYGMTDNGARAVLDRLINTHGVLERELRPVFTNPTDGSPATVASTVPYWDLNIDRLQELSYPLDSAPVRTGEPVPAPNVQPVMYMEQIPAPHPEDPTVEDPVEAAEAVA